jgi:hypothetical protein
LDKIAAFFSQKKNYYLKMNLSDANSFLYHFRQYFGEDEIGEGIKKMKEYFIE